MTILPGKTKLLAFLCSWALITAGLVAADWASDAQTWWRHVVGVICVLILWAGFKLFDKVLK